MHRSSKCISDIRLVFAAMFMIVVGVQAAVIAQGSARKSAPLAGVTKMTVLVEGLDDEGRKSGLTEERLRTIAELKLRLGGVRVLTTEQDQNDPETNPYLYVNVNAMSMSDGARYVFSVDVSLRRLVRSPINSETVDALLWSSGGIAGAGRASMPKYAEDYVSDLVDSFLNDFLKANPKK